MKIDHAALYTFDLERLRAFYEDYFDGKVNKQYRNEKTGLQTYFISFADGARLELMTRPELEECERSRLWTGWTHLAVKAWTRENVVAMTARLRGQGLFFVYGSGAAGYAVSAGNQAATRAGPAD